jgi:hypothetical protein
MEKLSNNSQNNGWFSPFMLINHVLKTGLVLLVFGLVVILLFKFNIATDYLMSLIPTSTASVVGGGIIIFALTLIGVPIVPALVAGGTVLFLIEHLIAK